MRALTTTSFAILGWLEIKPWTTYELAQQIQRNLRFFWPRTRSRLLDEPKNLLERGLATAESGSTGRRPHTMYSITDAGRTALREWQASKCDLPSLEFEGLTRVFFGASATSAELIEAARTARMLADQIQGEGRTVAGEYLAGRYVMPERVHLSGLTFDLLWSYADMLRAWSDRAVAEIETWPDTSPSGEKRERALGVFRQALAG